MTPRICLAVETSGRGTGVAVARVGDGEVLSRLQQIDRLRGRQPLLPMIEEALAAAGIERDAVGLLACAIGPGSFTGLRVGLATLKGIAMARRLPLVGVSTLAAVARSVAAPHDLVAAVQDAKKKEIYAALFRGDSVVIAEGAYAPALFAVALARAAGVQPVTIVGDGLELLRPHLSAELLEQVSLHPLPQPDPAAVAALAVNAWHRGETPAAETAQPAYHRLSEAQVHGHARAKKNQ